MTEDEYYERCEAQHSEAIEGCISCEVRATRQTCERCGVTWEDGEPIGHLLVAPSKSECPKARGESDDGHVLFDDWDNEILCARSDCADSVTTAGATFCDFHQRQADAAEAGRIYQRMVSKS